MQGHLKKPHKLPLGISRPMRNYHLFLNAAFILGYGPYCSHMTICFRTNQVFPHSQLSCYYLYHFFSLSGCVLSYYVTLSSTVPVLKRGSVIDYLSLPPWALHSTMFRTCHDSYFLNVHKPLFIFNEGNSNYVMLLFAILWCINTIHLQFSILLTGSWDYPETMNFSQK